MSRRAAWLGEDVPAGQLHGLAVIEQMPARRARQQLNEMILGRGAAHCEPPAGAVTVRQRTELSSTVRAAWRCLKSLTGNRMLYTIAMILLVLWILGLVTSYTMGGFIHVLLVIAVIMILLRLIQGQRL